MTHGGRLFGLWTAALAVYAFLYLPLASSGMTKSTGEMPTPPMRGRSTSRK